MIYMKKSINLTIALTIGFAVIASAQNNKSNRNFKFIADAAMYECDIAGNIIDTIPKVLPSGSVVVDLGNIENKSRKIIKFWVWDNTLLAQKYNFVDEIVDSQYKYLLDPEKKARKYFLVDNKEFEAKTIPYYALSWVPALTAGAVLLPIKMRFNGFDFSKDITLGSVVGAKWRVSHYDENYLSVLAGFGITSVTLDSSSTKGKISAVSDRPALTPSFGVVFEFSNNIQVGAFVGADYLSAKENTNWIYDKMTWLSIGLGYNILSKSSEQKSKEEGKN